MNAPITLPRRGVLAGAGALVMAFTMARPAGAETPPYGPPEDQVDSWLAIGENGAATLFTGVCELGTGSTTGLLQVMAEELDLPFGRMRLVGPDTDRTPDQFVSSGSRSIADHAVPIRLAAAEARAALVAMAAEHLGIPSDQLVAKAGMVQARDTPGRQVSYAALIGGRTFNRTVTGRVAPKPASDYSIVGTSVPRTDLPGKVFGTFVYMQDVTVPGMLHGRVVRPPAHGATVVSVDEASVAGMPGLVRVVRVADLVGVVCRREEQAIAAAAALAVTWSDWSGLPGAPGLHDALRTLPEFDAGYPKRNPGGVLSRKGDVAAALASAATTLRATYESPYNHHGSIGPSCAIADVQPGRATLWSGTQTPYGLREAAAKFLGLSNADVRLIYHEASGCYGQNGADDVVIDAIVLSRAVGAPVRVQWSRADENGWEALKAARTTDMQGGLDAAGRIVAWHAQTYGLSGYSRPEYHEPKHGGEPGSLVTAQLAGWTTPGLEEGFSGAAGNFAPPYEFAHEHVAFRYLGPDSPRGGPLRLRVGSMRGVGSPDNVFAVETFIDELAALAAADPAEFRLRHLTSDRHIAVTRAVMQHTGWRPRVAGSAVAAGDVAVGRGIAVLGTDNAFSGKRDTVVAGVLEVAVDRRTGRVQVTRAVLAQDCGLVVNPDAVRNQIEGGVVQNTSRGLLEQATWDAGAITSLDWNSYPIITFPDVPLQIETVLIDRPDLAPMRVGEPCSEAVWPALGNAIFDAVGVRLRQLPFTPERVLAGLAALHAG